MRAARRSARQSTKASVQYLRGGRPPHFRCGGRYRQYSPSSGERSGNVRSLTREIFGSGPQLNNAVPSVQSHYRTFLPTTDPSATVSRIGTLVLTALCIESSC